MVKYLIGIDEVGRGPLAGPFVVCAFYVRKEIKISFRGIHNSKKLTANQRERWEKILKEMKKKGLADFSFASVSPKMVDKIGLTKSANLAVKKALFKLSLAPKNCMVFLDGGLKAPDDFCFQKTIVKGDEKIKIISCASVLAKVRRDRTMRRLAKTYPNYDFEIHKGYGTRLHYSKIKKHGPSPIHRQTFLKKIKI